MPLFALPALRVVRLAGLLHPAQVARGVASGRFQGRRREQPLAVGKASDARFDNSRLIDAEPIYEPVNQIGRFLGQSHVHPDGLCRLASHAAIINGGDGRRQFFAPAPCFVYTFSGW